MGTIASKICCGGHRSNPKVKKKKFQKNLFQKKKKKFKKLFLFNSVKGKVVIDAFRNIKPEVLMLGQQPRQTTSNIGHLQKPSIQALMHGLDRNYYSMPINYRKNELEMKMLMNLHKKSWTSGLTISKFEKQSQDNAEVVEVNNLILFYFHLFFFFFFFFSFIFLFKTFFF